VIAHTDCGMLTFTNDDLHDKLPPEGSDVDFLPFSDLDESVRSSLRRIRESPLLPDSYAVTGFVYDVGTGRLRDVA
jgi:carbonic anhydrase